MAEGYIERRAGDPDAAERALRGGLDLLERIGDRGFHGTVALELAQLFYDLGRFDDALELCSRARATTESNDLINFAIAGAIEGSLLARDGRFDEGVARGRGAVELTAGTDGLEMLAVPRRYLAETLFLAGETAEAERVAAEALAIRDRKGDVTGAALVRELFQQLGLSAGSAAAQ